MPFKGKGIRIKMGIGNGGGRLDVLTSTLLNRGIPGVGKHQCL